MAAIQYNHSVSVAGVEKGPITLAERFVQTFKKLDNYRRLRRAERELMALDSRLLDDIGIERNQIHQRVWNGRKGR